jgi:hypothetical protein
MCQAAGPLYYEAPHYYQPRADHLSAIFLAGGMAHCPRWQDTAVDTIRKGIDSVVIFNPNRAVFPTHDPDAGWEQVTWEQHHLHLPGTLTLFWFPASDTRSTTQPIAMFELGQALGERRPLVVGADPGYPREADVRMLCQLNAPGVQVHATLDSTLRDALQRLASSATVTTPARHSETRGPCPPIA